MSLGSWGNLYKNALCKIVVSLLSIFIMACTLYGNPCRFRQFFIEGGPNCALQGLLLFKKEIIPMKNVSARA